jgi:hypothetical protein
MDARSNALAKYSYGYMDTHKKHMIAKWIAVQSSQLDGGDLRETDSGVSGLLSCPSDSTDPRQNRLSVSSRGGHNEDSSAAGDADLSSCGASVADNCLPHFDSNECESHFGSDHPLRILSEENITIISTLASGEFSVLKIGTSQEHHNSHFTIKTKFYYQGFLFDPSNQKDHITEPRR